MKVFRHAATVKSVLFIALIAHVNPARALADENITSETSSKSSETKEDGESEGEKYYMRKRVTANNEAQYAAGQLTETEKRHDGNAELKNLENALEKQTKTEQAQKQPKDNSASGEAEQNEDSNLTATTKAKQKLSDTTANKSEKHKYVKSSKSSKAVDSSGKLPSASESSKHQQKSLEDTLDSLVDKIDNKEGSTATKSGKASTINKVYSKQTANNADEKKKKRKNFDGGISKDVTDNDASIESNANKRSESGEYIVEHTYLGYDYEFGTIWPQPRSEQRNKTLYTLSPSDFGFSTNTKSDIILAALKRYHKLLFPDTSFKKHAKYDEVSHLKVLVEQPDQPLDSNSDESYHLTIASPTSELISKSIWGALRGLETFSQAVFENGTSYVVNKNKIADYPRFSYRGFLIDTSRHFITKKQIYQFLDAMAYSKFNILHWHIVDDPSFPFVSRKFPQLSKKGAFTLKHVYTPRDVSDVIRYALYRGIRVVPEFDTPGHSHSWNSIPGLLTDCSSTSQPEELFNDMKGPINPIGNATYDFLEKFFSEVSDVFPDKYIHLGGDEVDATCWLSNPKIQDWLKENDPEGKEGSRLHTHYLSKLVKIIEKLDKRYIVWQEVFDDGVKLQKDAFVQVWKDTDTGMDYKQELEKVTAAGHKAILSSPWYLNRIKYGFDWPDLYTVDPHDFPGSDDQKKLVIGGAAAIWGEYVDGTNIIARAWGRAFAVAERLWSSPDVTDVKKALKRIWEHQCRYLRRGIPAEPVTKSRFCKYEWESIKE